MSDEFDNSPEGLSVEEKAAICSGVDMWHLEPVESKGLESVMITDGPHGLRKQSEQGIAGVPATCFPTAAGLAASWDPDLLVEIGQALGRECLAEQVAVLLGPGANIKRHPLCGRNFEYFSEDPLLTGVMAAALIEGVQSQGVGTSLKHYAANNQEAKRMVVDTIVDDRTLRETYLTGFEMAVRESQPWTVMCAYNKINGTYCSEHEWLLTTVLRDEWGFDGIVVTDWGATNDRPKSVAAGLDLEMPGSGGINDATVVEAVLEGRLAESALDSIAARMIDLIAKSNASLDSSARYDVDAHHALARRAAAETAVLMTNDGFLPLDPTARVAVIGEFATDPRYQGAGSSMVTPTKLDTLLDAVTKLVEDPSRVRYAAGYEAANDNLRPDLVDEAVLVARSAEVVIVSVGLPSSYESEAYDRPHMRLPEQHNNLVRAVTAANPNTVVVLSNGSAVQIPWVDEPRAIVEAFLGGQASGGGVADVLYGVVNPGGKLSETFALRQSDHASDAWFGDGSRQVQYREGVFVGYRWFDSADIDVLFPFGHGLSYTTFSFSDATVDGETDADADDFALTVSIEVTNTGNRAGSEVVQVYVRDLESSVVRPDKELKGFAKVALEPGESETVTIEFDKRAFAFWDTASHNWQVEAGDFEILVGASSRDIRSEASVSLSSSFQPFGSPTSDTRPSLDSFADDAAFAAQLGGPIPEAEPVRPFHRNSTLGEISEVPLGAALRKGALVAMPRMIGGEIELDDSMKRMLENIVNEVPIRSIALLSGGRIKWGAVDRLVSTLNRHPIRLRRSQNP